MSKTSTIRKHVPPHLRSSQGRGIIRTEASEDGATTRDTAMMQIETNENKSQTRQDIEEAPQYLYIIRHGDRWDHENPNWKRTSSRPLDPPLSQLGHNQARETGLFLDQLFQEDGISSSQDITWISSPFLRCLQTSNEAMNALTTLRGARKIRILPDDAVREWGDDPRSLPPVEERRHYFPRVDATYKPMFVPHWPEPSRLFQQRCKRAASTIGERCPFRPNTAVVVVTHAAPCIGITEAAASLTWADINPAAPCGIYRLSRTRAEQKVWTMDGWSNQIEKGGASSCQNFNGHVNHMSNVSGSTKAWHPLGNR